MKTERWRDKYEREWEHNYLSKDDIRVHVNCPNNHIIPKIVPNYAIRPSDNEINSTVSKLNFIKTSSRMDIIDTRTHNFNPIHSTGPS